MTPSARTMPVVTATWKPSDRAWSVVLPGGFALLARTEYDVQELVAKHAPGAAIRWLRPSEIGS